jgi:hypothetical protein
LIVPFLFKINANTEGIVEDDHLISVILIKRVVVVGNDRGIEKKVSLL